MKKPFKDLELGDKIRVTFPGEQPVETVVGYVDERVIVPENPCAAFDRKDGQPITLRRKWEPHHALEVLEMTEEITIGRLPPRPPEIPVQPAGAKTLGCALRLDLEHDPHAIPALRAYADSCEAEFPELARSLRVLVGHNSRTE